MKELKESPIQENNNIPAADKDGAAGEEAEILKQLPFKLGEHGGIIFPDSEYEFCNRELFFKDKEKYEKEAEVLEQRLYEVWGVIRYSGRDKIKELPLDEIKKAVLACLYIGKGMHTSFVDIPGGVGAEDSPLTSDDFKEPFLKEYLDYLAWSGYMIHTPGGEEKGNTASIKDFLSSLPEDKRIKVLEFTLRRMLVSGHERSDHLFVSSDDHGKRGAGILTDSRFLDLMDKLDKKVIEFLWVRDAVRDLSRGLLSKESLDEVAQSLHINPEEIYRKSEDGFVRSTLLFRYPELEKGN